MAIDNTNKSIVEMNKAKEWHPSGVRNYNAFDINSICIGSSIWIAQNGLLEFHPDSDTFSPNIEYPETFTKDINLISRRTRMCKFKEDSIVIIYRRLNRGIVFDTKTRDFSDPFTFGIRVGRVWSVLSFTAINNHIHIIHRNSQLDYIGYTIYSMADNTERTIEVQTAESLNLFQPAIIKSCDTFCDSPIGTLIFGFARKQIGTSTVPPVIGDLISNFCILEIFKFGGWNMDEKCNSDAFYIGALQNGNPAEPIQWRLAPQYRLKHPMLGFGYIRYDSFIVTFGGSMTSYGCEKRSDSIFILDLCEDRGWIESPIKCPMESGYRAVLDASRRVHLNEEYWIDLKDILPQICESPL